MSTPRTIEPAADDLATPVARVEPFHSTDPARDAQLEERLAELIRDGKHDLAAELTRAIDRRARRGMDPHGRGWVDA